MKTPDQPEVRQEQLGPENASEREITRESLDQVIAETRKHGEAEVMRSEADVARSVDRVQEAHGSEEEAAAAKTAGEERMAGMHRGWQELMGRLNKLEEEPPAEKPLGKVYQGPWEKKEAEDPREELRSEPQESFWERNRERFSKLGEKAKEFAGFLYEKSPAEDIVDRAKIMYHNKIAEWHAVPAAKLTAKLSMEQRTVSMMESNLRGFEEKTAHLRELGQFTPKTATQAERERMTLTHSLERARNEMERTNARLEDRNRRKDLYEHRRNELCGKVIGRIEDTLRPYEAKLSAVKERREILQGEISKFETLIGNYKQELQKLEEEAARVSFKFEIKGYKKEIAEVKKAIRAAEDVVEDRKKSAFKIDKKIITLDKKADPWRIKRNEFIKITERSKTINRGPSPEMPRPASEKAEEFKIGDRVELLDGREGVILNKIRDAAGSTFYNIEFPDGAHWAFSPKLMKKAASLRAERLKPEEGPEILAEQLISRWNNYFGSEFKVDPKLFERTTGVLPTDSAEDFFEGMSRFYEAMKKEQKTKLSHSRFKINMEIMKASS